VRAQLISYDLRKPGRDYAKLFAAIQSIGAAWWHCLESAWIVKTSLTSAQVRDQLRSHVDANDKVLVTALGGDWESLGLDENCNAWLHENL
jgi:hypothetical protein